LNYRRLFGATFLIAQNIKSVSHGFSGRGLARDDWEDVFQDNYPLLDEIAELGAELETTENTEYAANIIHEIKEKLSQIN